MYIYGTTGKVYAILLLRVLFIFSRELKTRVCQLLVTIKIYFIESKSGIYFG